MLISRKAMEALLTAANLTFNSEEKTTSDNLVLFRIVSRSSYSMTKYDQEFETFSKKSWNSDFLFVKLCKRLLFPKTG